MKPNYVFAAVLISQIFSACLALADTFDDRSNLADKRQKQQEIDQEVANIRANRNLFLNHLNAFASTHSGLAGDVECRVEYYECFLELGKCGADYNRGTYTGLSSVNNQVPNVLLDCRLKLNNDLACSVSNAPGPSPHEDYFYADCYDAQSVEHEFKTPL